MTYDELIQWITENSMRALQDPDGYTAELSDMLDQIDPADLDSEMTKELLGKVGLSPGVTEHPTVVEAQRRYGSFREQSRLREDLERGDLNGDGTRSYEEEQMLLENPDLDPEAAEAVRDSRANLEYPEWLLDEYGRYLTSEDEEELLDLVEQKYGYRPTFQEALSKDLIEDWMARERAERLVPGPDEEDLWEPTVSIRLRRGDNAGGFGETGDPSAGGYDLFTMRTPVRDNAVQALGLSEDQLASVITLADMYGVRRQDGTGVAWQPVALLAAAHGQIIEGAGSDRRSELYAKSRKIKERLDQARELRLPDTEVNALRREYDVTVAEWRATKPGTSGNMGAGGVNSLQAVIERYKKGLSLYNNEALALINGMDEGLAARISASVGDPAKLDPSGGDARLVGQYVSTALPGLSSIGEMRDALVSFGYGEAGADDNDTISDLMSLLAAQEALLNGGGGGRERIMPDRVAVKQTARDMYQQLYMAEPTEAQLEAFTNQVMAQAQAAPLDENVDVSARARDVVENQPEYQELYGQKPNGMADLEYQQMMRAAQTTMLGNEAAGNQAAKLGMRGGEYQTAVGAAAGTSEAWDNSTFLGRLAQAAQTVNRNT